VKPRQLEELRTLVHSPEFQAWWQELQRTRAEADAAEERLDELRGQLALVDFRAEHTQREAIEALSRAGTADDDAARTASESSSLENQAYVAVGDYEEQRYRASDSWYHQGAMERLVDERLEAVRKAPSDQRAAGALAEAQGKLAAATEKHREEERLKAEAWARVEGLWERSSAAGLLVAEQKVRAGRIRKRAERLFAEAEERKRRAAELRHQVAVASSALGNAESRLHSLIDQARVRFDCAAGSDFLYFPQKDRPRHAFCVPLVEDRESYNIEVVALALYTVDHQRGITFLEPAGAESPPSDAEGDRRFEDFLLKDRGARAPRPS
jgi:hypothetical protein